MRKLHCLFASTYSWALQIGLDTSCKLKTICYAAAATLLTFSCTPLPIEASKPFGREPSFTIISSEADGLKGDKRKINLKLTTGFPAGNGPFPVVVILHGSGNMNGRDAELGKILIQNNIAWIGVQSFNSRRLENTDYFLRLAKANIFDQVNDAYAALDFIQKHPDLDSEKVALTGFSLGGTSAAVVASGFQNERANGLKFKYFLSMYGGCLFENSNEVSGVKIDFVWGLDDSSTPKSDCEHMKKSFQKQGAQANSYFLQNTKHGWFSRKNTVSKSSFQGCHTTIFEKSLKVSGGGQHLTLDSPSDMSAMKSFGKLCHKKVPYILEANAYAEKFSADLLIKNTK